MYAIYQFIAGTVRVIFVVLDILMLGRALLSWLPLDEDNPIEDFLYNVTEPVIMPVRAICDHFGWFEGLPLDIPFLITAFLIMIIGAIV